MKLCTTAWHCIFILSTLAGAATLNSTATWVATDASKAPGSAGSLQILSSSATGSHLVWNCPGFWTQRVIQNGQMRTQVILPDIAGLTSHAGQPELPALGKLLAIPEDRDVQVIVQQVSTAGISCENPYLVEPPEGSETPAVSLAGEYPSVWADGSTPGILKDFRVAPVNLYPVRFDAEARQLIVATHLEVEIRTDQPATENVKTFFAPRSLAFEPIYDAQIDNLSEFNTAAPLVGEGSRGKYLIFIADAYQANSFLNSFITWKRQLGYQVVLKLLSQVGSSKEQIKAAITQEYYAGDAPLDYVLLIGDAIGPTAIPYYTIMKPGGGEIDPTDHPYSLLEGQDYFPDIMVGRISITTDLELSRALSKILAYEKNPYLGDPSWFKRAMVSAGNYSDVGIAPITPAWTSLWLMDKLYDYGYTEVDTVIYWGSQGTYPGTTQIAAAINAGVGIVAYRGWGAANGWQYPVFQTENIYSLTNGQKLPVVVSIVCETGNFADSNDPCFGEAWVRGAPNTTPNEPKGAVSVFAPSDLHTNTKWNNAMYAGFFEGLLEENLYRLGQSALRSKIELYNGFPEDLASGGLVEFYFNTYNVLGDPELPIWTDIPQQLNLEAPAQVQPGRQELSATVKQADGSPLGGAYIAFYKTGEILAGGVADASGTVTVDVEPLTAGLIIVTASKQNCKAKQDTINVQISDFPLGLSGLNVSGDAIPQAGETFNLSVTIHNYGANPISGVSAVLTEADPFVSVADTSATVGDIPAAGDAEANFAVTISSSTPNGHVVEFTLPVSDASHSTEIKFTLPLGGLQLIPAGFVTQNGSLEPGNTAQIRLLLCNAGIIPAQGVSGTLSCLSGAVNVVSGQVTFPAMQPNATALADANCVVSVQAGAATGQQVIFELALMASGGYAQTVNFPVQLGQPASSDPLGPDSYGYYAYDDTDTAYADAPTYAWIELDTAFGGSGAQYHPMGDDVTQSIALPFTFKYYGMEYDSLSICSNGYVSFGVTWMAEFRNWNVPSALGPPSLVAPFWDDLKPDTSGGDTSANINIYTWDDAAEGRFIVEWSRTINRFRYEEPPANWYVETFELILLDPAVHQTTSGDGEILCQYFEIYDVDDNNNYATVGIEDEGHRRGLEYAYSHDYPSAAAPLAAGRAIKFTTNPPGLYNKTNPGETAAPAFAPPQPNPANPATMLRFTLPRDGQATMELYNTLGQRVAILLDANLAAGEHALTWDARRLSSGLYFAVLRFEGQTLTQKLLILK